jgi:hypothetical protein
VAGRYGPKRSHRRRAHRLELEIAAEPYGRGIFRDSSGNYTAINLPLGVESDVIEDDKTMRFLRVWSIV